MADDDFVVGEVDKDVVQALVEELTLEESKEKALAVSHSENVSAWVVAISAKHTSVLQRLIDFRKHSCMSLIEVWIAALLGGFQLEQRGGFYEAEEIWLT